MAGLSTHVLDVAKGAPAHGVRIEFFTCSGDDSRQKILETRTNKDGRTDQPILKPEHMKTGTYELVFHIGDYFAGEGAAVSNPPFLDRVAIRFTIADRNQHYHVPLLAAPWSYTTYRGS